MSGVTRYSGMGSTWTMPSENGDYVKYDDYAALEAKCEALRVQLELSVAAERAWERTMMYACGEDGPKSVADKFAALEARCSALAAENAGLKDINAWCKTDAFKNMYREFKTAEAIGCHDVDCMHDAMLTAIMNAPETPATDAFLAEVRAQGVEMAMEHMKSSGSLTFGDCYISLNEFAAKLRRVASSTMLQGAEPVTDNMNKQFESLSRGDK